jgi:hypothetical protein
MDIKNRWTISAPAVYFYFGGISSQSILLSRIFG